MSNAYFKFHIIRNKKTGDFLDHYGFDRPQGSPELPAMRHNHWEDTYIGGKPLEDTHRLEEITTQEASRILLRYSKAKINIHEHVFSQLMKIQKDMEKSQKAIEDSEKFLAQIKNLKDPNKKLVEMLQDRHGRLVGGIAITEFPFMLRDDGRHIATAIKENK